LFRKAGAAGPIDEDALNPKQPAETFYPRQVVIDGLFALVIITVLAVLAQFMPFELGPKANPADTTYLPRPEWYYIPIFQWLKYWPGSLSFLGVVVIPSIVAFAFASLPFLDKRMERRPWKRPIAVGSYVFILLALFGLGYLSYHGDHENPGYAAQLIAQNKASEDFMKQPFEPELSQASLVASNAALSDPVAAKGEKIYQAQSCNACHGDGGSGTPAGPKLAGIHSRQSAEQLTTMLKMPSAKMAAGGMMPSDLPADDLTALVAYLGSLK
jgi:mono/diheme cytochrome c family protein